MTKIRYVLLNPEQIFNWLAPENVTAWMKIKEWQSTWWTPETVKKRKLFGQFWTEEYDKITQHFTRLEESIKKSGLLRPVSVITGRPRDAFMRKVFSAATVPPGAKDVLCTHTFGGSRVSIAQRLGIKIPSAVYDFDERFTEHEQITKGNFRKWFGDEYMFVGGLPNLRTSKHCHNTGKYGSMNQASREAQRKSYAEARRRIDAICNK